MYKHARAVLLAAAALFAVACGDHVACDTNTDVAHSCTESSYSGAGAPGAAQQERDSCALVGGKLVAACETVAVAACDRRQSGGDYTVATTTYFYTGDKTSNDRRCATSGGAPR